MRPDLATITPEALAALANVGLVKRAQREIAEGKGPTVREEADGTVVASFAEGVSTKLLVGKALKDTFCSCGAKTVCRHRIAAVLAYSANAGAEVRAPWTITTEELAVWLGERLAAVDAADAAGVDVELGIRPPTARFSGCTVRFLAGADLTHARCDCAAVRCNHVPLAVRAFQRLSVDDRERALVKIRLGPPPRVFLPEETLAGMNVFLGRLLARGITDARGLDQAREEARAQVQNCPWLEALLDDIETQRAAWENRSALHDAGHVRGLLMEGFARYRAAKNGGDTGALLGVGEPLQVPLEKARLLSLGARLSAIGSSRSLEVLFWDGATVVSWMMAIPTNVDAATLTAVGQTPLGVLAAGQVVSRHLVRLARRTIEIRRGKDTAVLPQRGQWVDIPAPFGFSGPSALLRHERERPPWFLRPRARTESLRVISTPRGVQGLSWSPARQTLSGWIEDDEGSLRIERAYEWFAPGAIAALAKALPSARYVSGWLRGSAGSKVLEPIAVVVGEAGRGADANYVLVPDLAPDEPIPALSMMPTATPDPLWIVLGRLESALDALAQDGILAARIPPLGPVLMAIGLRNMAETYTRLEAMRAAGDIAGATNAWADAAIAVALARA